MILHQLENMALKKVEKLKTKRNPTFVFIYFLLLHFLGNQIDSIRTLKLT